VSSPTQQSSTTTTLRQEIYDLQQDVNRLQQIAFGPTSALSDEQKTALHQAEHQLFAKEQELAQSQAAANSAQANQSSPPHAEPIRRDGVVGRTQYRDGGNHGTRNRESGNRGTRNRSGDSYRSFETTGLEVDVQPQMQHVPTALLHLFDKESEPLIECTVRTNSSTKRRLRITSYIEGYSAQSIDTIEISADSPVTIKHLPTLFPAEVQSVGELTRATVHILAEDISNKEVEVHKTVPVWLLARNSVPLSVKNPADGSQTDLTKYLGAFVTPHQPDVLEFLREAAECHPEQQFVGYQGDPPITDQVEAIYNALQKKTKIRYINSVIDFPYNHLTPTQRTRLPRETLSSRSANCLDGTLLFASLLEAISLNPCIVLIPGHAFVGWQAWRNQNQWHYLETTMVGDAPFKEAFDQGMATANDYRERKKQAAMKNNPNAHLLFREWSLKDLRTQHNITPLE